MPQNLLTVELCQLRPTQLDNFVLALPYSLPYSSQMYASDMDRLAQAILEHESLGDALARIHRYTTD